MSKAEPVISPAPPPEPGQPPGLSAFPVPSPGSSLISEEDKSLAMLCHLLGIFTGFLGPLILWLVKKDSSAFIAHHGREALNFQITVMLVMLCLGSVTFILMLLIIGILLVPVLIAVPILALIAEILATVAAQNGKWYRYPCCLRLV